MSDEEVFKTRNTRKAYFPVYFFSAVMLAVAIYFTSRGALNSMVVLAVFLVVFTLINITEIHRLNNLYEVNPRSVVATNGYLSIVSRRVDLSSVSDVIIFQSMLQRILNFGDIHLRLFSVESQAILKNVNKPRDFADLVEEKMALAKRAREGDSSFPGTVEILG